jgi:hypothetical protein
VCHDFYPICQVINPQFGKTCERCTLEDLRLCAASNPLNRIFVDQSSEEWEAMRSLYVHHLLAGKIELAVPSPWVAVTMKQLQPRLQSVPMHLIPHGIDLDAGKLPYPSRDATQKLRLVVLGRLSLHKGLALLREAAAGLDAHADVTLLGCGRDGLAFAREVGWRAVEKYDVEQLPALLRDIAPHAGVLASVIPETFSYTLSELFALGVPPLATALGSFRERIAEGETGFLFDPRPDALVALVARLRGEPDALERVARNLAARPPGRGTAEMTADYRALLPMAERPVARFAVGIGTHSALTEPYRHLTEAYAQLNDAYSQLTGAHARGIAAYEHTRGAYEQARAELERLRAAWDDLLRDMDALDAGWQWWRGRDAVRAVRDARRKAEATERESSSGSSSSD